MSVKLGNRLTCRDGLLLEDVTEGHRRVRELVYKDGLVLPLDIVEHDQGEDRSDAVQEPTS